MNKHQRPAEWHAAGSSDTRGFCRGASFARDLPVTGGPVDAEFIREQPLDFLGEHVLLMARRARIIARLTVVPRFAPGLVGLVKLTACCVTPACSARYASIISCGAIRNSYR